MTPYDKAFYEKRHRRSSPSARRILSIVREIIPDHRSIVDLGCGVGTWLSVAQELGFERVEGIEGTWATTEFLRIPERSFRTADLEKPVRIEGRFDLAISLEVAEHISENASETFVSSLVGLSDFILFSAAIPGQGGTHHVNERWPSYWVEKFLAWNYEVLDVIRPRVWNEADILVWYKQNTLLFAKRGRMGELRNAVGAPTFQAAAIVHPDLFASRAQKSGK